MEEGRTGNDTESERCRLGDVGHEAVGPGEGDEGGIAQGGRSESCGAGVGPGRYLAEAICLSNFNPSCFE